MLAQSLPANYTRVCVQSLMAVPLSLAADMQSAAPDAGEQSPDCPALRQDGQIRREQGGHGCVKAEWNGVSGRESPTCWGFSPPKGPQHAEDSGPRATLPTANAQGRLIITPVEQVRSLLHETFGMWAGRHNVPDNGLDYVDEIPRGGRVNAAREQMDETD